MKTVIAVILSVAIGRAQAPPSESNRRYVDEARGVTVDALVTLALEKAPAILAARARVDMARGDLTQASARPNPSASFEWREQVGGTDNQSTIGFTWPLDLSRRDGRTNVAGQQVAGAEFVEAEAERQLRSAVRLQAGRVLAAARQLDVRERIANAAGQVRDLLSARVESGSGTPLDRDVAEVEWRRAQAEVARQRRDADAAVAELRALVGLSPEAPLILRESLENAVRSGGVTGFAADAAAFARAIDTRPDVNAAEREVALAAARTDLLHREARPDLSVTGAYMRMDAGFPQFGLTAGGQLTPIRDVFHNVAINAAVTLPWRNRQQGAIASAMAAEQVARHERDALRLRVAAEIDAARIREREAGRVWEIYSAGLVDLAARNLQVTRESHQLGRATLVEVLAETRRYLDVETAYTDALIELFSARVVLTAALGGQR